MWQKGELIVWQKEKLIQVQFSGHDVAPPEDIALRHMERHFFPTGSGIWSDSKGEVVH